MRTLALLLLLGLLAAGCRTTRAAAPVQPTPLEVPAAPPRVVVPAPPPQEASLPEPVPDLPPPPPERAKPRPAAAAKETPKPDAKAEEVVANASPPPAQTPPPAPVLRTPATADPAAAERGIRDTMSRAQGGLKAVRYERLSPELQKAHDQAVDFLTSAEAQIKAQNFELAKELAEKAEKLVKELQGR